MKVLIVEDNADDRKILRFYLERRSCGVIEASDGEEGLELARIYRPELIISDALMPNMDGFQLLRRLKKDRSLGPIPFIFYSAVYTGEKEVKLGISLGAETFIVKPKEPEEFWEELDRALEKWKMKRREATAAKLIEEDEDFLKKYSAIVVAKLEAKVRELESTIDERSRAEREINFLASIVRNIPDAVVSINRKGEIIFWNEAAKELFCYAPEEIIGKPLVTIIPQDLLPMEYDRCMSILGEEGFFRNHKSVRLSKEGRSVPVYVSAVTVKESGSEECYTFIMKDITECKGRKS